MIALKTDLLFYGKLCMIVLILVLSACATIMPALEQVDEPPEKLQRVEEARPEKGWFAIRFTIFREKGAEPEWYVGTLIAGEIISPVLDKNKQKIICWRVHRRAVADKTGHVFSFIFYSSQTDATKIYQFVKNNKLINKLYQQQLLQKVIYDPLDNGQKRLADTSDPAWPETIRSSWPFFMMGASQMWLEQIRHYKQETLNPPEMQQRYRLIQSKMTDLWQQQGQSAMLHHLNALYAYQAVLVRF